MPVFLSIVKNDHFGIVLQRSTNGGKRWSDPVEIEQGVAYEALTAVQGVPPVDAQAMPGSGNELAVAWVSSPGVDNWPLNVWVATSDDGGESFSEPKSIAETWQAISTASHDGTYFIFYRQGGAQNQELVVAISHDGGVSWESSSVSGDLPLSFSLDKAPVST